MTKRGAFARRSGAEPFVVSVMPCTAKKDEAVRPGMAGDVDRVLTTRELARMIRARGIAFGALSEVGVFDDPLGGSTGAAQIFASSGGVMEALARTALHLRDGDDGPLEWETLRGVDEGLKTATLPGMGRVAVCNGIASAQRLLANDAWRERFIAIEVMACVGGCLGGGGEPKSMDRDILRKRMGAIYEVDRQAIRRRSHENPDVQALYASELGVPGSPAAHALLHTAYAGRRSARLLLMRFLDCVDRRDGAGAARLFHPQGTWDTASAFGVVKGAAAIAALIESHLPPAGSGAAFLRHRMASAAGFDGLAVIMPDGRLCRFEIDSVPAEADGGATGLIHHLVRRDVGNPN